MTNKEIKQICIEEQEKQGETITPNGSFQSNRHRNMLESIGNT